MSIKQSYDKIFKEGLKEVIEVFMKSILFIEADSIITLDSKLQVTEEREPDFLLKVTTGDGVSFILHLEFQTTNDKNMIHRMLRYFVFIRETYKLSVRQVLIYVGKAKLSMESKLNLENIDYRYELLDMRDIPCDQFLNSEHPAEVIVSILCQTKIKDASLFVRQILKRLQEIVHEETLFSKCIKQLEILSCLRDWQNIVIEEESKMSFNYKLEEDIRFKQGKAEGELKGELLMLEKLYQNGKLTEEDFTNLSEPLKKKLEQFN